MISEKSQMATACLFILAAATLAAALYFTRSFMVPVVLAAFATFIISPVVRLLEERARFTRTLAILCSAGFVVLGMILSTILIGSSLRQALSNIDVYREALMSLGDQVLLLGAKMGLNGGYGKEEILARLESLPVFSYFQVAAGTLVNTLTDLVLTVLIVAFLLSGNSFKFPETSAVRQIEGMIRSYLVTKLVTSAVTGLLTTLLLSLIGLDAAVMFGFLAFVLNFIPTIGSMIATLLPLPLALAQFGFTGAAALVVALPGAVQFLIGNVFEPKLMGASLDLHPVSILMSLLFWGLIWGVPGMVLATPILVIFKIILLQHDGGLFFAELIAGRILEVKKIPARAEDA